jgi:ribosome biogenesis protein BRX1
MGKRKLNPTKPVEEDIVENIYDVDEEDQEEMVRNRIARARSGKHNKEEEEKDNGAASDSDSDAGRNPSGVAVDPSTGRRRFMYTNKQRVLVVASRGITARYRHLLEDLKKLIPHHKKDSKLDTKGDIRVVNEIAEVKSCNQVVYLECRKHTDLYLYVSRTPHGPSAKFQAVNIHTMDELKLTGNCMLGSRPLLNFDAKFDTAPHLQMYKQMLTDVFNTPLGHPKSKPFVDRVMSFYVIKDSICESVCSLLFHHVRMVPNVTDTCLFC